MQTDLLELYLCQNSLASVFLLRLNQVDTCHWHGFRHTNVGFDTHIFFLCVDVTCFFSSSSSNTGNRPPSKSIIDVGFESSSPCLSTMYHPPKQILLKLSGGTIYDYLVVMAHISLHCWHWVSIFNVLAGTTDFH